MMNVVDGAVDESIAVEGRAEVVSVARSRPDSGGTADEVRISWRLTGNPDCVWIQRIGPGEEYTALANFVLRPKDDPPTDRPGPVAGRYCYRFFVVSARGHSQPSASCVEISTPSLPLGPFDGPPGPPETGASQTGRDLSLGFAVSGLALVVLALFLFSLPRPRRNREARPGGPTAR